MVLWNWYHCLYRRFHQIPTFGSTGTICRFATNASEMKKLAGWDFEDLLQCVIPIFERLLPEPHNNHVMKLLFRIAEWHGLAKLRMHTDMTLAWLEQVTTDLGHLMRDFRDKTCAEFNTTELACEVKDWNHHNAQKKSTSQSSNLLTYKFHALGDYVRTIHMFGTTDSFSTQLVCARPYAYASQVYQSLNSALGRNCALCCETLLWSNQQAHCEKADRSTISLNGGCPARTEESTQAEPEIPTVIPHPTWWFGYDCPVLHIQVQESSCRHMVFSSQQ